MPQQIMPGPGGAEAIDWLMLNRDRVPLVGVDAQGAFLMGLRLDGAPLARANFSSADLRDCHLHSADLSFATLAGANFRNCDLEDANLENADLSDADLTGANLDGAHLAGANLTNADLQKSSVRGLIWKDIAAIRRANILHVKSAPDGFVIWATGHGAVGQEAPVSNK